MRKKGREGRRRTNEGDGSRMEEGELEGSVEVGSRVGVVGRGDGSGSTSMVGVEVEASGVETSLR